MKNLQLAKYDTLRDLNRFFEDDSLFSISPFPKLNWDLAIDSYEEDDNLVVKMSVPGINQDELEISLEDNILTIFGRRNEEQEVEKKDYYSKEIKRGSFARSFSLPKAVDPKASTAQYKDGELLITMPIVEKKEHKGIFIPLSR